MKQNQFKVEMPGWIIVNYKGTPKVDEFYITDKGFVQQCTIENEACNRMIVERMGPKP